MLGRPAQSQVQLAHKAHPHRWLQWWRWPSRWGNATKTDHTTVDLAKGSLASVYDEIVRLAGYVVAAVVTDHARQLREKKN